MKKLILVLLISFTFSAAADITVKLKNLIRNENISRYGKMSRVGALKTTTQIRSFNRILSSSKMTDTAKRAVCNKIAKEWSHAKYVESYRRRFTPGATGR